MNYRSAWKSWRHRATNWRSKTTEARATKNLTITSRFILPTAVTTGVATLVWNGRQSAVTRRQTRRESTRRRSSNWTWSPCKISEITSTWCQRRGTRTLAPVHPTSVRPSSSTFLLAITKINSSCIRPTTAALPILPYRDYHPTLRKTVVLERAWGYGLHRKPSNRMKRFFAPTRTGRGTVIVSVTQGPLLVIRCFNLVLSYMILTDRL